ncbi:MAG: restriction endonuclease [Tissierellaceae bacterium]|nr:restriction endonuclease [Tissierellaceae bacterium]
MKKLIEKLKEISLINNRKKILKNYYSKELRKGKTYRASFVDRVLIYGIFFIVLSVILIIKSNQLLLSMFISAIAVYFVIMVNSHMLNKSKIKKTKEINNELKKQKLVREFSNFNKEDFNQYIKKILEDYYDVEVENTQIPLDLKFTKDGDTYGVKCALHNPEDKVSTREVDIFLNELNSLKFDDGILITNTHFTDGIQDKTKVILMDFNSIVEVLKKLDRYPTDKDMEDYIVDRFIDRRNGVKSQVKDFNKRKIIQLYGLCAIFYVLSYFISYPKYYRIMAVLSFVIATLISGYKISEYIRLKDSINIDQN